MSSHQKPEDALRSGSENSVLDDVDRRLLIELTGVERAEQAARLRREGWRLVLMTVSLAAMTALVFAVLLGGPPALLVSLRLLALFAVLGVLVLSLRV